MFLAKIVYKNKLLFPPPQMATENHDSHFHFARNQTEIHFFHLQLDQLHNEKLHNLYSSPSIIRMIKSRKTRWAGHVEQMGKKRTAYRTLVGQPEGKRPLGRQVGGWIILKWTLE
jgi:hypothetical protein